MFQRFQTVLLLIATILTGILSFVNIACFMEKSDIYIINIYGIHYFQPLNIYLQHFTALIILFAVVEASQLATIFLYKKRMIQIAFCGINIVLLIAFIITMLYYVSIAAMLLNEKFTLEVFLFLPLLSAICNIWAIIRIWKDEKLVKSLDRIR